MQDITKLSLSAKEEIAGYIKRDTLDIVNELVPEAKVRDTFYTRYGKRIVDIIIGFIAFVISLPFNAVIAVVTFFDVGRPIIFKQQRIGKDEKPFTIYKFRNMTNETDANGELLPAYQRVTKWGKFVRRTSLDELLNFFFILKGDMSIIGPRPILDYYVARLNKYHKSMYAVRPGLECPTLNKVDHALSWQERLDNNVWYVENCSLRTDVKLMFRVIALAFDRRSTVHRASVSYGSFMGYDLEGNVIYTKAVPDKYVDEYIKKHGFSSLEDAINKRTENC